MIGTDQIQELMDGGSVVGQGGDNIGKVGQIYLDDQSGTPEWVTVKTGMFGGSETFIPLTQATVEGTELRVPYTKATIKSAPRQDDENGHLSPDQEKDLYRYYGLDYTEGQPDREPPSEEDAHRSDSGAANPVGRDTSGPTTDDAMTRSEEQLTVGTERRETGRARLRKYVVTENVTQTVPVSHEEVRLEREPITDANRGEAMTGGDITEEEHEVTLHEERPVVTKETVPVERVRMDTETVTGEEQISEQVRKEQIEAEGDSGEPGNRQ